MKTIYVVLLLASAFCATAHAEDGEPRGRALLEKLCALPRCRPNGSQPASRCAALSHLRRRQALDNDLAKRLQDGLGTIHPDMPTFHFKREDAEAAVSYLRSIQVSRKPKPRP
jgi:hypothetical protein